MLWQLAAIILTSLSAYIYCVWKPCKFVIDDTDGIQNYDGKIKEKSYYSYIKHFWYVMAGKDYARHHWFSVLLQMANCVLLYLLIGDLFNYDVAFLAALLFAVHPINTQSIAWISARGYPLGLFFLLVSLHIPKLFIYYPSLKAFPILGDVMFGLIFLWATVSQFTTMLTFPVLLYMRHYNLAILSALIMAGSGLWLLHDIIKHRASTFKAQAMEKGTTFNARKFIVAIKTLGYYTQLCVFPAHMGIYHKWGYHYNDKTEKEDSMFWVGLGLFISFCLLFVYGNPVVRFGIIWYFSFLFIFLNWITIHQFVSERYCYIANIGLCLIIANYLVGYPVVSAFILGLYLMRTWQHLPTYCEELRFYLSNIWNFPDSEVAMANLGVILMKGGLQGMAIDYWIMATKVNPNYDVPYYNLYSTLKLRGDFNNSRKNLVCAISAPTCHFREMWTKELEKFDKELLQNKDKLQPWQVPEGLKTKIIDTAGNIIEIPTIPTLPVQPTLPQGVNVVKATT